MTIQAQLPHSGPPARVRADHATLGMPARPIPITADAFALLDHRTRSRTVAPGDAPRAATCRSRHGDEVRLIPLDRPIIHIGRGLTADVRIEDPQVSRRHAIIAQRGDGVRVLDDRSSNGTFVNGRAGDRRLPDRRRRAAARPRRHALRRDRAADQAVAAAAPDPAPGARARRLAAGRRRLSRAPAARQAPSARRRRRPEQPTVLAALPDYPLHCAGSANSRSRPNHAAPRHIRGRRGRGP